MVKIGGFQDFVGGNFQRIKNLSDRKDINGLINLFSSCNWEDQTWIISAFGNIILGEDIKINKKTKDLLFTTLCNFYNKYKDHFDSGDFIVTTIKILEKLELQKANRIFKDAQDNKYDRVGEVAKEALEHFNKITFEEKEKIGLFKKIVSSFKNMRS